MLSAGAAASISVDADIVRIDDNVNILLDVGHDVAGDKGRLSRSLRVEGGDADKSVYASLGFEIAVSVRAVDLEIHGLDARLIAVHKVHDVNCKSLAVRPSRIHSVKHGAPVAAFCAAGSRVKADDRVGIIILAGEKGGQPHILEFFLESIQILSDRFDHRAVILFISHLDEHHHVLVRGAELIGILHQGLQILELFHFFVGSIRIVPEIRRL